MCEKQESVGCVSLCVWFAKIPRCRSANPLSLNRSFESRKGSPDGCA